jgi:hypothetical protein
MKYKLRCLDCGVYLKPLVTTEVDELLLPDYEQCEREVGVEVTEAFKEFHESHCGHTLKAEEV